MQHDSTPSSSITSIAHRLPGLRSLAVLALLLAGCDSSPPATNDAATPDAAAPHDAGHEAMDSGPEPLADAGTDATTPDAGSTDDAGGLPSEVEPNDDGAPDSCSCLLGDDLALDHANGPFTSDALIAASIEVVGDEDLFAIENTGETQASVAIATWATTGVGTCTVDLDTYLVLRAAAGDVLMSNDNGSVPSCSALTIDIPAGQRIYAQILDYGDDRALGSYLLQIDFL